MEIFTELILILNNYLSIQIAIEATAAIEP